MVWARRKDGHGALADYCQSSYWKWSPVEKKALEYFLDGMEIAFVVKKEVGAQEITQLMTRRDDCLEIS